MTSISVGVVAAALLLAACGARTELGADDGLGGGGAPLGGLAGLARPSATSTPVGPPKGGPPALPPTGTVPAGAPCYDTNGSVWQDGDEWWESSCSVCGCQRGSVQCRAQRCDPQCDPDYCPTPALGVACCGPAGGCGAMDPAILPVCVEHGGPGTPDPICPAINVNGIATVAGCCRSDGTCGGDGSPAGLGCVAAAQIGAPTVSCCGTCDTDNCGPWLDRCVNTPGCMDSLTCVRARGCSMNDVSCAVDCLDMNQAQNTFLEIWACLDTECGGCTAIVQ